MEAYAEEQVDAIYLLYSEFRSAIQQRIVLEKILPVIPKIPGEEAIQGANGRGVYL